MGNTTKNFTHILNLIVGEGVQIRDNSIESARMAINRHLVNKLGKDGYFMKIRIYPYNILRENKQTQGAHADRILIAVARIVGLEGRDTFSWEDIRKQVGVTREEWMSGYTATFQAMRQDQPGRAPQISEEYRGVFGQVRDGIHTLTDHGYELIRQLDHE